MKNTTLFILAVALFGVMVAVSFLKAERANRQSTSPVEESLRSAPPRAAVQDAQSAVPGKRGATPVGERLVDKAESATHPTASGGAQKTLLGVQSATTADKTKTTSDPVALATSGNKVESSPESFADSSGKPLELEPVTLMAIKRDIDASKDVGAADGDSKKDSQREVEGQTERKLTRSETETKTDTRIREEEILDYYQERLDQLPDDLTSYEKKVAIKEVRDEVLEIFKITPARLKKLTKSRKINYP